MEIIEQNDKPIDEIEKLLLLPYHGKKADYVIKSMKKRLKKLFSKTFSTQIKFTNRKLGLCFHIKDETKFEHKHVIYYGKWPEDDCPNDYIGETKRLAERFEYI